MTTTDQTPQTPEQIATVTPITSTAGTEKVASAERMAAQQAASTHHSAVRGTWKQHGNPVKGFEFYGTAVKSPAAKGSKIAEVTSDPQGISLWIRGHKLAEGGRFGNATKFWAIVPADAPRKPVTEPKPKAEAAAPIEITAAKGGDKFVAPIKGAIAKAIVASGENIQAISRKHGLNPSQMRRLAADSVAKVDLVRAEVIAKALGVKVESLFGAAEVKASKAVKAPADPKPATTGKAKSKATKGAEKAAAAQAEREAATMAATDQDGTAQIEAADPETTTAQAEPTTDQAAE